MRQARAGRPVGRIGRGQLSLVEHALCPLAPAASLKDNLSHVSEYFFFDRHGNRRRARARIDCPRGLSASDEFFLWGLLALTFSDQEPGIEFRATPHYCLRQLGQSGKPGGKNHRLFREALRRLAAVNYRCDNFYDPIRGERCAINLGFLSYRLPLGEQSSRAWRIVWNPIFFEFCEVAGGSLQFDLHIYQQLDTASRRLFLFLQKIFWRRSTSPLLDLRHLAVDVLGYAPTLKPKHLKAKVSACAKNLADVGIIADGPGTFKRIGKGDYQVVFRRGPYFEKAPVQPTKQTIQDSRFYEPLKAIGFDKPSIARIIRCYKPAVIDEWADITLAAMEHNGPGFFSKSPQAYFTDNARHANDGRRGVPDWWHAMRREELRKQAAEERQQSATGRSERAMAARRDFAEFLKTDGRVSFERLLTSILDDLKRSGETPSEVQRKAKRIALDHMRKKFMSRAAAKASPVDNRQ